ncbi:MAG: hypothetical protein DMF93_25230 [Acidobacteria bacterium]|nr:MAG: hypothetical protein DMF93_25230 [Acidobacteriota bacterium]
MRDRQAIVEADRAAIVGGRGVVRAITSGDLVAAAQIDERHRDPHLRERAASDVQQRLGGVPRQRVADHPVGIPEAAVGGVDGRDEREPAALVDAARCASGVARAARPPTPATSARLHRASASAASC